MFPEQKHLFRLCHFCLSIYYNIYRDEFFGEARIWSIPDVNYDFDSTSLGELEEKLRIYMVPRLQEIRQIAMKEAASKEK